MQELDINGVLDALKAAAVSFSPPAKGKDGAELGDHVVGEGLCSASLKDIQTTRLALWGGSCTVSSVLVERALKGQLFNHAPPKGESAGMLVSRL